MCTCFFFSRSSSSNYDDERSGKGDNQGNAEGDSANSNSAHQQYLGDTSEGLPEGPTLDFSDPLPENVTKDNVVNFVNYYRSHCEVIKFLYHCLI